MTQECDSYIPVLHLLLLGSLAGSAAYAITSRGQFDRVLPVGTDTAASR